MRRQDKTDIYGVKQSGQELYEDSAKNRRGSFNRSGYYHRYFEGWSEYSEEVPGKGRRIRRVYTAPWKVQEGAPGERKLRKLVFGVLLLASAACLILAGTRYIGSNSTWYVSILQFGATVLYILMGGACLFYAISPYKMTLYQWKSTSGLVRSLSFATATGMELLAVAVVVYLMTAPSCEGLAEGGNIALYLAGAGFMLAIFRIEQKTKYVDFANDAELPQSGTMIR